MDSYTAEDVRNLQARPTISPSLLTSTGSEGASEARFRSQLTPGATSSCHSVAPAVLLFAPVPGLAGPHRHHALAASA